MKTQSQVLFEAPITFKAIDFPHPFSTYEFEDEWELDETTPAMMPQGTWGTLVVGVPGQPSRFSYAFTADDVLWLARFIVGEAGGKDNLDNRAVIWAMFNRYALFTHKVKRYDQFHKFIQAYSTPLQPVLNSAGAAKRHCNNPTFVRTKGFYKPPNDNIPKGQLKRFLNLQKTPWSQLPAEARSLAELALKGQIPNPGIGIASEFANTAVYFKQAYKRFPNAQEWRQYTKVLARKRRWTWIGDVPNLSQIKQNAFFIDNRVKQLPANTVQIRPGTVSDHFAEFLHSTPSPAIGLPHNPSPILTREAEWELDAQIPKFEGELEGIGDSFFSQIGDAVDWAKAQFMVRKAILAGNRDKNQLTSLVFFARHPERQGRKLNKSEPNFQQLSREWLEIRDQLVRPILAQTSATVPNTPAIPVKGSTKVDTLLPRAGPGFYSYKSQHRQFGLPATIQALKTIGATWQKTHPQGPRIGIGEISLKGGGDISGHKSHEKGVDVDIYAMPNDGKEKQVWAINWFKNSRPPEVNYNKWLKSQRPGIDFTYTPNYSQRLTQELVNIIRGNGILRVQYMFFNDPAIKGVTGWPNHNNHLHIRFYPPSKTASMKELESQSHWLFESPFTVETT